VVASAAALISSKLSTSHSPNARASRALANRKQGSPLHPVVEDRRLDAARRVQQLHPAVVAGDQRSLGRRQRDVELALRVLAVDEQRSGDADRHLGDADELLDVPGQLRGVERVVATCSRRGVRPLAQERPAGVCRAARVVVLRVTRNRYAAVAHGGHRVSSLGGR
jgi:hypothetical protein